MSIISTSMTPDGINLDYLNKMASKAINSMLDNLLHQRYVTVRRDGNKVERSITSQDKGDINRIQSQTRKHVSYMQDAIIAGLVSELKKSEIAHKKKGTASIIDRNTATVLGMFDGTVQDAVSFVHPYDMMDYIQTVDRFRIMSYGHGIVYDPHGQKCIIQCNYVPRGYVYTTLQDNIELSYRDMSDFESVSYVNDSSMVAVNNRYNDGMVDNKYTMSFKHGIVLRPSVIDAVICGKIK